MSTSQRVSQSKYFAAGLVAASVLAAGASAQKLDASHRLRQKGEVKNGGIYHLGSGTWTRAGALKTALGPTFRTIYNNTCSSPIFAVIYPNEVHTDEGRLPGVNSPDKLHDQTQDAVATFVGTTNQCDEGPSAHGSARGSAAVGGSYSVDGFQIGYCSDEAGPLSTPAGTGANIDVFFRDSTAIDGARCADGPLVAPAANASFSLVSFPGAGAGPFGCWLVAVDLTGVTASFTMRADGNGNFNSSPQTTGTELTHCFSWSFSFPGIASPTTTSASGMIVAGVPADFANGGWATATTTSGGLTAACAGYDGTVWDLQEVNAAPTAVANANGATNTLAVLITQGTPGAPENGTGMSSQDSVRIDLSPATSVNGCYFFGGPAVAGSEFSSYHLELYTVAATTVTPLSPGTGFCFGDNCAFTCPCVAPNTVPDPSGGHESGCANSNPLALAGVLGTKLTCTGVSTVSALPATDSVRFFATGTTVGFGFLVKGNAKTPNGVFPATADGIRCASGGLVRFGGHNAGSNGDAAGTWSYPNTAQTTTVSSATAQTAGQNAQYQLFYRNPAAGWCNTFTTNFSNGQILKW
ncbi:MAG: hypothetical protein ACKVWV_07675 [Planctomycetota bacterium]